MTQQVHSSLKRTGGKHSIAGEIVAQFPPHNTYKMYVEPCCGACHVLLAKPRYKHDEIINDTDGNLIAYWMEMVEHGEELQAELEQLPYSYDLYYKWYPTLFDGSIMSQHERAKRYYYCLRLTGTGWLRKSRVGWHNGISNVHSFRNSIERFKAIQGRMRYVLIDKHDILDVIAERDSPNTFFYIDPPYVGVEHYYEGCNRDEKGKKIFPHQELAEVLHQIKGKAALSYYPHPLIDGLYADWRQTSRKKHKDSQIQLAVREEDTATEILLMNYEPATQSLWDTTEEREEEESIA